MQRSGSQKVLLVLSIITVIGAVLSLLAGFASVLGGSFIGALSPSDAASLTAETGLTQGQAIGAMSFLGIGSIISAIVYGIEGFLGIRAANDATKIKPVWILAVVGLALAILGLVLDLFGGNGMTATVIGRNLGTIVGNGLMFWIANNIKRQANL